MAGINQIEIPRRPDALWIADINSHVPNHVHTKLNIDVKKKDTDSFSPDGPMSPCKGWHICPRAVAPTPRP